MVFHLSTLRPSLNLLADGHDVCGSLHVTHANHEIVCGYMYRDQIAANIEEK